MRYECEDCHKTYETEQAALECENKHRQKREQTERLIKEGETKLAELQEAVEKFNETYGTHLKIVDKYRYFFW